MSTLVGAWGYRFFGYGLLSVLSYFITHLLPYRAARALLAVMAILFAIPFGQALLCSPPLQHPCLESSLSIALSFGTALALINLPKEQLFQRSCFILMTSALAGLILLAPDKRVAVAAFLIAGHMVLYPFLSKDIEASERIRVAASLFWYRVSDILILCAVFFGNYILEGTLHWMVLFAVFARTSFTVMSASVQHMLATSAGFLRATYCLYVSLSYLAFLLVFDFQNINPISGSIFAGLFALFGLGPLVFAIFTPARGILSIVLGISSLLLSVALLGTPVPLILWTLVALVLAPLLVNQSQRLPDAGAALWQWVALNLSLETLMKNQLEKGLSKTAWWSRRLLTYPVLEWPFTAFLAFFFLLLRFLSRVLRFNNPQQALGAFLTLFLLLLLFLKGS